MFYVYEIVPLETTTGDPNKKTSSHVKYPQGFDTPEEADALITRRKQAPGFANTEFVVKEE